MLTNEKLNPIVTELCTRAKKLTFFLFVLLRNLISLSQKNIRLNIIYYFVMKVPRKENLHKSHLIFHHILTVNTF